MQLVVLGSGTSVPHPTRAAAAFWLETSAGSILLDCSADATHRMAEEKLDWSNLDAIWISHLHLDHCGGLASFLFGIKHAPQSQGREKPLTIFCCDGIRRLLKGIDEAGNYRLLEQHFPVRLRELTETASENGSFEILPGLSAQTFSTPHTQESSAIRLRDRTGPSIVYSSDTGYSEGLASFAQGADIFILECSFQRNKPVQTHLELTEAMRLATLSEPRTLLLTHLYPEWDRINVESEARKLWPGETIAAYDGLRLDVGR
jgi:ribonuclease BN (tRNA processing enzyme)